MTTGATVSSAEGYRNRLKGFSTEEEEDTKVMRMQSLPVRNSSPPGSHRYVNKSLHNTLFSSKYSQHTKARGGCHLTACGEERLCVGDK